MLDIQIDKSQLRALGPKVVRRATERAFKKAGSSALRDMKSEFSKRVRQRKNIRAAAVKKAIRLRRPKGGSLESMQWAIDVSDRPMRVIDYPGVSETQKGITVKINKGGKRSLIRSAFVATMSSKHVGIFVRRGASRLPIDEKFASRVIDAIKHPGQIEAVQARGMRSIANDFPRLLELELEKAQRRAAIKGGR